MFRCQYTITFEHFSGGFTGGFRIIPKIDTERMKWNCQPFAKELAEKVFHPLRLERMSNKYNLSMDEYIDLI